MQTPTLVHHHQNPFTNPIHHHQQTTQPPHADAHTRHRDNPQQNDISTRWGGRRREENKGEERVVGDLPSIDKGS
ncbi:hypothetical protein Tsubulata_006788 [Turnera subulata]|uniref:Uncharacterized protein n=1 Tax=Turnera subulata TaxID=218843 RepID=A0A9Q0G5D9_9ROSI|nr:hypothetical protein Tsubulata_006788 [Turnera subulata]